MDQQQQEQFQYVYTWLKSIYGDRNIPRFEITPTTLSHLYKLAQINTQRNSDVELLTQDAIQFTNEFKQQGLRMQNVLHAVGVDAEQIEARSPARTCSNVLVSLSSSLLLKDTQNSSYFIGINELRQETDKLEQQQAAERLVLKNLMNKTTQVVQRIAELKRVLEQLEEQTLLSQHTASKRSVEISYLSSKAEEYKETLQNSLPLTFDSEFSHSNLLAESSSLTQLKTLTTQVNEVLTSYMDLPPDISMAKLKIEEAKAKLSVLEETLSTKLGGFM